MREFNFRRLFSMALDMFLSIVSVIRRIKYRRHLPISLVTCLFIISIWLTARGLTNDILLFTNLMDGNDKHILLMGKPKHPALIELFVTFVILVTTWLLSTKVHIYQGLVWRIIFFFLMVIGTASQYLWNITAPVSNYLIPYLHHRASLAKFSDPVLQKVLVGNTSNLMIFFLSLPVIGLFLVLMFISKLFTKHHEEIIEWFREYEFKTSHLQFFFKGQEKENWPDVILGPEKKTNEKVIQKGRDRTLNNVIIGPIGTGKTSSLILPIINQDLHHMTRMINDFPFVSTRDDYHTEEVKGMYLNGLTIIEPSNDLCQKAFQLVKAHGIPEEAVFYIDPTNPNTESINPFKGPVDKVAEAITMVIEGVGETQEYFFAQSQRNHLKYYVYLLKLHDPDFEPTFSDLIRMYGNAQIVRKMHLKLKETIPKNWQTIEERDLRNHWEIVKGVDEWFNMNLLVSKNKGGGNELVKSGEHRGEDLYYDAKAEFVVGLRNILDDIASNKLMRRVLFSQSNFDFDKHLEFGGVLLLNSAKGELGTLSNILGKFILLSIQNAVFRREPNVSSFHHLLIDEAPDFLYKSFREFPAQSRKYKTIITIASQTLSQLAADYGDHYMQTLLGTLRHKMVFGDLTPFDAKLFSEQLGEDTYYEGSDSEQNVSPLYNNAGTRTGTTYSKVRQARMTLDDLIFQKAFECSVKLVEDNEPKKVRQLTSNFVNKNEFKEAVVTVDEEAALYWLKERNRFLNDNELAEVGIDEEESGIEETGPSSSNENDINYESIDSLDVGKKPIGMTSLPEEEDLVINRLRSTKRQSVSIEEHAVENDDIEHSIEEQIEEVADFTHMERHEENPLSQMEEPASTKALEESNNVTKRIDESEQFEEFESWETALPFFNEEDKENQEEQFDEVETKTDEQKYETQSEEEGKAKVSQLGQNSIDFLKNIYEEIDS